MPRSIHHVNAFQETCLGTCSALQCCQCLARCNGTRFLTLPKPISLLTWGLDALRFGMGLVTA